MSSLVSVVAEAALVYSRQGDRQEEEERILWEAESEVQRGRGAGRRAARRLDRFQIHRELNTWIQRTNNRS